MGKRERKLKRLALAEAAERSTAESALEQQDDDGYAATDTVSSSSVSLDDRSTRLPGATQGVSRRLAITLILLAIAIPAAITIIGAVTSPPEAYIPTGHLIYMDADQPSEKTTMLHGMYDVGPDGKQRLILNELEPQDVDAGAREWITEPTVSPDGTQIAFVKELITILDEKQSVVNQIWIADLTPQKQPSGSNAPVGHMLYDLTANHVDMVTHLAWTPDGKAVAFLDGATLWGVPINGGKPLSSTFDAIGKGGGATEGVSNSALLGFGPGPEPIYQIKDWDVVGLGHLPIKGVSAAAVSPDGILFALANADKPSTIAIGPLEGPHQTLQAPHGWSIFGGRRITAMRFSPDGRFLAYSVSKPPVAEDELFVIDLVTKKAYKLPYRCGQAAWDWGQ